MIPVSEELRAFHSFLSAGVDLIVRSFTQQTPAGLPVLGTGVAAVNRTDRPCLPGGAFQ